LDIHAPAWGGVLRFGIKTIKAWFVNLILEI
jgi:hypothetical protein